MKEKENKRSRISQNVGDKRQNTGSSKTPKSTESGGIHEHTSGLNIPEKKPYSHRTGDATNFGDRSYRED